MNEINDKNHNHIIRDTATGAFLSGGIEYLYQRKMIKQPEKYNKDYFLKESKALEKRGFPEFLINHVKKVNDNSYKVVKSGKISWNGIAQTAAVGAVCCVGINYAINKLFNNKENS